MPAAAHQGHHSDERINARANAQWTHVSVASVKEGTHSYPPRSCLHANYSTKGRSNAPAHAADECLQHEVGEPLGRVLPALRLLYLPPHSQDAARYACQGIEPDVCWFSVKWRTGV